MDDILLVGFLETGGRLESDIGRLAEIDRPPPDLLSEVLPFDVLHRYEGLSVRLIDFVDRADVRMAQRRLGLRLMEKTCPVILASDRSGREEFQRDDAVQFRILRPVHHTHPAPAELLEYRVVRYVFTYHESSLPVR